MVVGEPVLPIGNWRDQCERSKLPPGAQLGFSAETKDGRRKRRWVRVLGDMTILCLGLRWEVVKGETRVSRCEKRDVCEDRISDVDKNI
jgi:hypothetical protein